MKKWLVLLGILVLCAVILPAKGTKDITVTILYDNYIYTEGTKSDWGFACLVKGTEKTILFDTGTKPDILFFNMRKLNVNLKDVEMIVLSHIHGDHTGGLFSVLEKAHTPKVYIPYSFPSEFVKRVDRYNTKVIPVNESIKICKNVYSTGEMGDRIKEQSLIIDTDKGLVLINGCSHPGLVKIVERAKEILKKKVYFVFGGFHLMAKSVNELEDIITQFKNMGVKKVGATHCTGEKAIELFKKAYKKNFIEMGVGKVVKL